MNEVTLVKPLSGPEIIAAIKYKVGENLSQNCLLAPHQAYQGVSFDVKIEIRFTNPASTVKEALGFAKGQEGDFDADNPDNLQDSIAIHEAETNPNELRRDTEQGIPALVKTPQGKTEEKKLLYQRKQKG